MPFETSPEQRIVRQDLSIAIFPIEQRLVRQELAFGIFPIEQRRIIETAMLAILSVEQRVERAIQITQLTLYTPAAQGLAAKLLIAVPPSPPQPGNVGLGGIEFNNIRAYHEAYETRLSQRRSPGAVGDHVETSLTHSPIFSFIGDIIAVDPSIQISDIETELRNAAALTYTDPDGETHTVRVRNISIARLGKTRYRFSVEVVVIPPLT